MIGVPIAAYYLYQLTDKEDKKNYILACKTSYRISFHYFLFIFIADAMTTQIEILVILAVVVLIDRTTLCTINV